jgi:membrane-associated phospholipid phosphatase
MSVRKLISTYILLCICFETALAPLSAKEQVEGKPAPETAPYEAGLKDLEFQKRSSAAEKFLFKDLWRESGGAMKESFWGWGVLGFGMGIGLTGALYTQDQEIQDSFETGALFGNTANNIIGWTLSPYTIGGVTLITWGVAAGVKNKKLALTCRTLAEALFLSMGINAVAKFSFRREAPDGGNFSFPSGHSTAAFATAGVLTTFYGWKAALPSYALASVVSISRVDDDQHWVSDVVMGAVLGTVIGIGTAKFQKKENPNFFLSPKVSREQAGINFTHIF